MPSVEFTYGPRVSSQGTSVFLTVSNTRDDELDTRVIRYATVEVVQGTRVGLDDGEPTAHAALVVDHVSYQLDVLGHPGDAASDIAQVRSRFIDAILASHSNE